MFASRRPSRLTTAMVVVTMTTGMIEAVSFVGIGFVFTAMMTGNLMFIGFDLAGVSSAVSHNMSLTQAVAALAAFALGGLAGHRVNGVLAARNDRWLASLTVAEGLLILLAAVLAIGLHGHHPGHVTAQHLVVIFVLAATMGWRNVTVRRVAVPDLLVTLVTGSLVGLLMGSWRNPTAGRRGAAVVAILVGALLGTLLLRLNPTAALLATAVALFGAAALVRGVEVKS